MLIALFICCNRFHILCLSGCVDTKLLPFDQLSETRVADFMTGSLADLYDQSLYFSFFKFVWKPSEVTQALFFCILCQETTAFLCFCISIRARSTYHIICKSYVRIDKGSRHLFSCICRLSLICFSLYSNNTDLFCHRNSSMSPM